jgi:hypothetical protein
MMDSKRILIVGTMVLTISVNAGIWSKSANPPHSLPGNSNTHNKQIAAKDNFLQAIGAASHDAVYDALLQGKSLAAIAGGNGEDVQNIINLQIAELTEQLDLRLASGSLPPVVYEAQKAEIPDIISKSINQKMNT